MVNGGKNKDLTVLLNISVSCLGNTMIGTILKFKTIEN